MYKYLKKIGEVSGFDVCYDNVNKLLLIKGTSVTIHNLGNVEEAIKVAETHLKSFKRGE